VRLIAEVNFYADASARFVASSIEPALLVMPYQISASSLHALFNRLQQILFHARH
jgi:hypothetical protein